MIKSFKHKGLKKFFEQGKTQGIRHDHANRLRIRLTVLNSANTIEDIDQPGFNLHPLSGDLANHWSISINGNWRLFFIFEDGDVYVLDYDDYH